MGRRYSCDFGSFDGVFRDHDDERWQGGISQTIDRLNALEAENAELRDALKFEHDDVCEHHADCPTCALLAKYPEVIERLDADRRARENRKEVCEWEWDDAHMETVRACDGLLCENGRHLKYDTGEWEDDTICGGCGRPIKVKE